LDITATAALLGDDARAAKLLDLILRRPSVGTGSDTWEAWRAKCSELDAELAAFASTNADMVALVARKFPQLRQHGSSYSEPIRRRAVEAGGLSYNRGFEAYRSLRPDIIATDGEYRACKLAGAVTDSDDEIAAAIRRTGHSVELTSFMGEGLKGLEE